MASGMGFPAAGSSGLGQLLRFLAVGCVATAVNATIYYLLYKAGVIYSVAMPAGFVSGSVVGYVLNSFFTFGAARRTAASALGYVSVNLLSLAVGEAVLLLLVERVGLAILYGSILVIFLTTALNFAGAKYVVFRQR